MEFRDLSAELRNLLKARGITYKDVANEMGMSESGVKKILTSKDISFNKLEDILKIAKLDLKTLLAVTDSETKSFKKLNKEQEEFFTKNINHFNFFIHLQHFEFDIQRLKKANPKLSQARIEKYLKDLASLDLIKREGSTIHSPLAKGIRYGNKLEGTTAKHINNLFTQKISEEIRENRKNSPSFWSIGKFSLSHESLIEFRTAQKLLLTEFSQRSDRDSKIYSKTDLTDVGFMQASIPLTMKELYPIE
ncbi:MAG: helix-turn-helix domain-containing protein [Bdellovibrionaceae bacterium]|nr:helix-turn-helix domain-containing protein [Pseudobdellovibrionaceae bacterium]